MKKRIIWIFGIILTLINTGTAQEEEKLTLLDPMEQSTGWQIVADQSVTYKLVTDTGNTGSSLGINYEMNNGKWIIMYKDINKDLSSLEYFSFDVKTEGSQNSLEIKLTDKSESTFSVILNNFNTKGQWQKVTMKKEEFIFVWGNSQKLDWAKIKTLGIAVPRSTGGNGKILIDNLEYKAEGNVLSAAGQADKLLVENFERSDPYKVYLALPQDRSQIDLRSVNNYVIEGNYAMEVYYVLDTDKSVPSSVSARYEFLMPLNWDDVNSVHVWVRGDSSRNILSIGIIDGSSELWEYDDYSVLYDNKWRLISVPLDKLRISESQEMNNRIFDKQYIQGIQFTVKGESMEKSRGKIYLDQFYVRGKKMSPENAVPEELRKPIVLERPQGNIDIHGIGNAEYHWSPKSSTSLSSYIKLKFDGNLDKYGAYLEIATRALEFGKSTYIETVGGRRELKENKPGLEVTSIQFSIREPFSFINEIVIGNLFENFSDYTFSVHHTEAGEWGYKGVKAQGNLIDLNYRMMGIKQMNNSYVFAGEVQRSYAPFYAKGIYVFSDINGHIENTGNVGDADEINPGLSGDFRSKKICMERTYTAELGTDFLDNKLHADVIAGENYYKKYGEGKLKDQNTDGQDFIYLYSYDRPLLQTGQILKVELQMRNLFWEGLEIYTHGRSIDQFYLPEFRRLYTPAGEYGSMVRISQAFSGWSVSGESDSGFRKTSKDYYNNRYKYGIARYAFYNFDFSFFNFWRFQDDHFYSGREESPFDVYEREKVYNFQVVYYLASRFRIREEQEIQYMKDQISRQEYESLRFKLLAEYFLSRNARFWFEGLWHKYGKWWEDYERRPTDENFYKIVFEINF